jgi:hypothetical protein
VVYPLAEVQANGSQMEIVIVLLLIACVIWVANKIWSRERDFQDASLVNAWRTVLSDPNYQKRRTLEERKYAAAGKVQTLGEAARETSES